MSDANPNELQATVDRLNALAGGVRKALGLGDDADDAAVLSALGTVTTQRDEAVASATKISTERNAEKIDAAVAASLSTSGIIAQNTDDAATILRGVLEVKDGKVVTKAAPNIVPGQTPEQFIAGQLQSMRPHYWPRTVGGGSKGAGHVANHGADVSCFREGGTLTAQMAVVARVGERAAIEACRRSGIVPPAWLIGGGR